MNTLNIRKMDPTVVRAMIERIETAANENLQTVEGCLDALRKSMCEQGFQVGENNERLMALDGVGNVAIDFSKAHLEETVRFFNGSIE